VSNPFYNYSGSFIPGTLARAENLATEYAAVQAGFALLVTEGVDSGVANAYVVTTGGQPTGAYQDGNTVEFKPLATNTGASTLAVNSIPAVSILRFNGAALIAGDLTAGAWTTATYNSTYGAFTLVGPGQTAVIPGSISSAAPTNKVGLVASGGVSVQAVPIDATYAIDQNIAPTWTGAHTFSSTVTLNGTLSGTGLTNYLASPAAIGGTAPNTGKFTTLTATGTFTSKLITDNGNVVIAAPAGGDALTVSGNLTVSEAAGLATINSSTATNVAALFFSLGGANKTRLGAEGTAGATVTGSSAGDTFVYSAGGNILFSISGAAAAVKISSAGNVTIAAPSSGDTLQLNRTGDGTIIDFIRTGTNSGQIGYGNAFLAGEFEIFSVGTVPMGLGTAGSAAVHIYANSLVAVTVSSAGAVTIAAPSSGVALTVNGVAGATSASTTLYVVAPNTSGQSWGPTFQAGTTSADFAFRVTNAAGTQYFIINGAGNATIAAPSSGSALTVTGAASSAFGSAPITTTSTNLGYILTATDGTNTQAFFAFDGAHGLQIGCLGSFQISMMTNSATRVIITSGGNVQIAAPASGTTLSVAGAGAGSVALNITAGTANIAAQVGSNQTTMSISGCSTSAPIGGNGVLALFSAINASTLLVLSSNGFTAGSAVVYLANVTTTGATTPTLGTNKPGAAAGAPQAWLPVSVSGTNGWIPVWA
jgi:hypothetical protein